MARPKKWYQGADRKPIGERLNANVTGRVSAECCPMHQSGCCGNSDNRAVPGRSLF